MLLFCMLLKKENCHDPKTSLSARDVKNVKLRGHGNAYKTRKCTEVSGFRAWPAQVPNVLQSQNLTLPKAGGRGQDLPWGDSDPDSPFCGTQMQERLLKIINAALFTKGASPGLVPPARPSASHRGAGSGVEGGVPAQSWWARPCRPHCGGSAPSWGPRGAPAQWQQGPALLSQEGTFSFGVPKKNCRTRSARSAKQKSRRRTWAMTSLNCGAGSAGESGAQTGPGCVPGPWLRSDSPPQGCPRARTGC